MIADYYFENMIDEPKVSDMTNIGNTLVMYGDDVTFEIKDYYEEEKKKLFEPIRRGAPSLPFDFMEKLKKIEWIYNKKGELKMEIIFSYPKKIDENRYEIAPGMYCNKIGLNDYFEEWKRTLGQKKKYCFDYIKEDVMKWAPDVRKNVTKQMIYMLPLRVQFPFISPEQITPPIDYYGEVIDNYDEWKRQREEYIEELYKQLKNGEEYEKDFNG